MKKVLIITYYWPPSGGGGVQRWVKFVKYLPKFNIEPIVLTVDANYAAYPLLDETLSHDINANLELVKTKSIEPLKLYGKLSSNKEIPYGGFANEENPGFLKKVSRFIRGNFFIPDARIGWNSYALKKAREIINKYNIETVITSSPPHSTQLIGLALKKEYGINWIADLRDPWTDIYYYNKMFHTSLAKKIDKKKEKAVLHNADKVIVVSDSIKKLFGNKLVSDNKINVIPNGFDEIDFPNGQKTKNNNFTITYTGTIADNYNIDGFLVGIIDFIDQNSDLKLKIKFIGRVSEKYRMLISNSVLNYYCEFLNHVDHHSSISFLQESDALFLAIPDVPQNDGILTGKLFEYLAAKKQIIAVGPVNGDASMIINECHAGQMFDYNAITDISACLNKLYSLWQDTNSMEVSEDLHLKYSRENLTKSLVELIG